MTAQENTAPQVPEINMQWHRNLWAADLDDDIVLKMITNPRTAMRLQEICYNETGASIDGIDDDVWDLIRLLQNRSALLLIGAVRYAHALANAAFTGANDATSTGLTSDILRTAMEIAQDVEGLEIIAMTGDILDENCIVNAGAEVAATWIKSMTPMQSAAIRMRFDPNGIVLSAKDTLDSQPSIALLQACWQRRQSGS